MESQFTRIKAGIAARLGGYTQTDDQKMALVRRVLEQDMPQYLAKKFSVQEREWSFRSSDTTSFRVLTNATLDDTVHSEDGIESAVLETVAWDMEGTQPAIVVVSIDQSVDGEAIFDLCMDGDSVDSSVGSWIVEDEEMEVDVDEEILLDGHPADHVVLKLTVPVGTTVKALRLRIALLGNAQQLSFYGNVIADFAAAHFWQDLADKADQAGNMYESIKYKKENARELRNHAVGLLNNDPIMRTGGEIGGPVVRGDSIPNPAWDRFKQNLGT